MNLRLFVADIDDTLRGRASMRPGPVTCSAFEEMHRRGITVGIASGRPLWQGVSEHASEWGLSFQFDFLIGMNGGELWTARTDRKEESHLLTTEALKEIVTTLHGQKDINPFVYREGYELSLYTDEEMVRSGLRHHCRVVQCGSEADLWAEPTGKILYRCGTAENGKAVEEFGKAAFGSRISCFRTGPDLVELQDPENNKGAALRAYCSENGISLSDAIAFGDAENDIEMLKIAGRSVCMINGMDDVKAIADDLTAYDCNHDGVGHYLYDHHLI